MCVLLFVVVVAATTNNICFLSLATASHWAREGGTGKSFVLLNGDAMTEYMKRYNVQHKDFAPFSLVAHKNALTAHHAALHKKVDLEMYESVEIPGLPKSCPIKVLFYFCFYFLQFLF